jgi:hypothetical protein
VCERERVRSLPAIPSVSPQAYRGLAKQHHPDKGGDPAVFGRIQRAYEILGDPKKRSVYDTWAKELQYRYVRTATFGQVRTGASSRSSGAGGAGGVARGRGRGTGTGASGLLQPGLGAGAEWCPRGPRAIWGFCMQGFCELVLELSQLLHCPANLPPRPSCSHLLAVLQRNGRCRRRERGPCCVQKALGCPITDHVYVCPHPTTPQRASPQLPTHHHASEPYPTSFVPVGPGVASTSCWMSFKNMQHLGVPMFSCDSLASPPPPHPTPPLHNHHPSARAGSGRQGCPAEPNPSIQGSAFPILLSFPGILALLPPPCLCRPWAARTSCWTSLRTWG